MKKRAAPTQPRDGHQTRTPFIAAPSCRRNACLLFLCRSFPCLFGSGKVALVPGDSDQIRLIQANSRHKILNFFVPLARATSAVSAPSCSTCRLLLKKNYQTNPFSKIHNLLAPANLRKTRAAPLPKTNPSLPQSRLSTVRSFQPIPSYSSRYAVSFAALPSPLDLCPHPWSCQIVPNRTRGLPLSAFRVMPTLAFGLWGHFSSETARLPALRSDSAPA